MNVTIFIENAAYLTPNITLLQFSACNFFLNTSTITAISHQNLSETFIRCPCFVKHDENLRSGVSEIAWNVWSGNFTPSEWNSCIVKNAFTKSMEMKTKAKEILSTELWSLFTAQDVLWITLPDKIPIILSLSFTRNVAVFESSKFRFPPIMT